MIACYTDVLSVAAGGSVGLHASSSTRACRLEIARVGCERRVVATLDVAVGAHPTPPHADRQGCDWPEACRIAVGADWPTGYYDLKLTSEDGETAHHYLCVRRPPGSPKAKAALVLATNTLHAYNWWGGANAYCDVTALRAGMVDLQTGMTRGLGLLSARRPFVPALVAMPRGAPRLMNAEARGFQQRPQAADLDFWREHGLSPFDGSAGYLNKWEHAFVDWSERRGVDLDYLTDYDLDVDPSALDGYRTLLAVGHSEYWSGPQRAAIERFVDAGGGLMVLSGNTAYWKVRWDDAGQTLVCHKWKGLEAEPQAGQAATHMWSHPAFAAPEAQIIGLTFLLGGYHRTGMCVARGSGAYTVYDERHWALEGADLFYGDELAAGLPLLGYENDGCHFQFDNERRLKALPTLGVPENLEIIAIAPCTYGEDLSRGYPPHIPPEDLSIAARIAFGDDTEAAVRKLLRGHAVMASFRRGKGEVFNVGTTEWAYALRAGDPMVERITLNVLRRFGALG